nr:PepSY-associated TM helix domain-containing protein [Steroidobacter sp.]
MSQKSRSFWLKHLHQWHWVSAAACLVSMLLFSVTGFTLNHASWISAKPEVTTQTAALPEPLLAQLRQTWQADNDEKAVLPAPVVDWLGSALSVRVADRQIEWSDDEVYVSLPRPGGDAWLTVSLEDGAVTHELTDRGWLSFLNDLHKGRNTGAAWSLFIDVFAFAALVFAVTGLLLLKMHASNRPGTWPMVGLGLALPLLLAILFIH